MSQAQYHLKIYKFVVVDIHSVVGEVAVEVGLLDDADEYTIINE